MIHEVQMPLPPCHANAMSLPQHAPDHSASAFDIPTMFCVSPAMLKNQEDYDVVSSIQIRKHKRLQFVVRSLPKMLPIGKSS